jgi:hypothetical protein
MLPQRNTQNYPQQSNTYPNYYPQQGIRSSNGTFERYVNQPEYPVYIASEPSVIYMNNSNNGIIATFFFLGGFIFFPLWVAGFYFAQCSEEPMDSTAKLFNMLNTVCSIFLLIILLLFIMALTL